MFLFSIAMGAPLRALRGRSAINNIKIITVFIFWGEARIPFVIPRTSVVIWRFTDR